MDVAFNSIPCGVVSCIRVFGYTIDFIVGHQTRFECPVPPRQILVRSKGFSKEGTTRIEQLDGRCVLRLTVTFAFYRR